MSINLFSDFYALQKTQKRSNERVDNSDEAHSSLSIDTEIPLVETGSNKSLSNIQSQDQKESSNKNLGNSTEITTKNLNGLFEVFSCC